MKYHDQNNTNADIYDNLLGIKLKGLFNRKNRANEDNPEAVANDGSGIRKIFSGLRTAIQSRSGLSANLNPTGRPIQIIPGPGIIDTNTTKKYTPYYIAGGIVIVIILIGIIFFPAKR